jgi:D-3-phosphoglycerate dehydrogenase / 2-oxoglutarate reductase
VIEELEIEVIGEAAELGATPMARAALAGLLRNFLALPVNEVNAPILAQERGLRVVEVKRGVGQTFAAALALRTRGPSGGRFVKGTIFHIGERAEKRIVQIDDFVLDATPEGKILLIRNLDRPGVIGAVGTLLGQRAINVARLHVGKGPSSDQSIMLWQVDAELPQETLDDVRRLANIESAQQVTL